MADKTLIEWTDATWNPVTGCAKVSQGCKHCYAEREWPRMTKLVPAYAGRDFTDVRTHVNRLDQPLRWRRPRRIFVNSMSDLFHHDVPDDFIDLVFAVVSIADRHTFQVLTKRSDRMRQYMNAPDRLARVRAAARRLHGNVNEVSAVPVWPPQNAWLGVSVEDQAAADERVPLLLETLAAVRWISAEPLLGQVSLHFERIGHWNALAMKSNQPWATTRLHWVVVGGESGPKARPISIHWVRNLRDQCVAAGVPFLFKQWGEWGPDWDGAMTCMNCSGTKFDVAVIERGVDICGHCGCEEWNEADKPLDSVARVGKKAAGRLLDGVLHDGYPACPK